MIQLVQERLLDVLEAAMSQHRPFNHPGIDISRTPSRMIVSELFRRAGGADYTGQVTVTFHWEEDHVMMKFAEHYDGLTTVARESCLRLSLKSISTFVEIDESVLGTFKPNQNNLAIQIQRMIQVLKTLSAQTKPE